MDAVEIMDEISDEIGDVQESGLLGGLEGQLLGEESGGVTGATGGGEGGEGGEGGNDDEDGEEDTSSSDSDDGFDLESLLSEIESLGEDLGEAVEEAKKFYTQMGCVVAMFGVTVNEGVKAYHYFQDENIPFAIFSSCMCGLIHFPTLVVLLVVLLKGWVKKTIAGFLLAKKKAGEVEDMIDGDTEEVVEGEPGNTGTISKNHRPSLKTHGSQQKTHRSHSKTQGPHTKTHNDKPHPKAIKGSHRTKTKTNQRHGAKPNKNVAKPHKEPRMKANKSGAKSRKKENDNEDIESVPLID